MTIEVKNKLTDLLFLIFRFEIKDLSRHIINTDASVIPLPHSKDCIFAKHFFTIVVPSKK